MGAKTGISWTDHTFNPVWGCLRVSPGCEHCYAEAFAKRMGLEVWGPKTTTARRTFDAKHWNEPLVWDRRAERDGVRRRVFCGSMCDIFEDHPTVDQERAKLWPLIRATPHLDWQLLTKRPERIAQCLPTGWSGQTWPNVWLGTSVEDQSVVTRVAHLVATPARCHFISAEPLIGPVRFPLELLLCLEWIIVGGESGRGFRDMNREWARDLLRQSREVGAAYFFKQRAGPVPGMLDGVPEDLLVHEFPGGGVLQHG